MSFKQQHDNWIIFQQNQLVMKKLNELITTDDPEWIQLKEHFVRHFFVGRDNDVSYYCAEIDMNTTLAPHLSRIPLRTALNSRQDWLTLISKAIAIINWDKHHQFCGQCGRNTKQTHGSFERQCTHCHLSYYPRISPSIIVLIKKGNEILMTRSPHFPPGAYGLVAGFVEAGENLEQALHREIREEVNITVTNVAYFGSQTWPFPDSLMVGFTADYLAGDIVIDPNEIESANWYNCNNLPGLPSSLSIARQLIAHVINKKETIWN